MLEQHASRVRCSCTWRARSVARDRMLACPKLQPSGSVYCGAPPAAIIGALLPSLRANGALFSPRHPKLTTMRSIVLLFGLAGGAAAQGVVGIPFSRRVGSEPAPLDGDSSKASSAVGLGAASV